MKSYPHVVTIEEMAPTGGLASAVKSFAFEISARCRIDSFSLKDEFIHCYGSHADLLEAHGLGVKTMLEKLV